MKKFIKYHSIDQFRNVVRNVIHSAQYIKTEEDGTVIYDKNVTMPTVRFHGTVKLHGTNAGVSYSETNGIQAQKRTGICTIQKDNVGFALFVKEKKDFFIKTFEALSEYYTIGNGEILTIYGEWCGEGIQKGVAISKLPKMFVIFGLKVTHENNEGDPLDHEIVTLTHPLPVGIYNIENFKTFDIDIDFNYPQESQNKLAEFTESVEKSCPVGQELGSPGIGEGVVWRGFYKDSFHYFKVKGQKHSTSKVKKLAEIDIEKIQSIREFIDYSVVENRLNQGIEQVFTSNGIEPEIKKMGDFIRWVFNDIIKEELDTLMKNNLTPKDIGSSVANKVRPWFQSFLDAQIIQPSKKLDSALKLVNKLKT